MHQEFIPTQGSQVILFLQIKACDIKFFFSKLIDLAGMKDLLDAEIQVSKAAGNEFAGNWTTAEDWTVTSRYEAKTEAEARKLFAAISDKPYGVLQWIQTYW